MSGDKNRGQEARRESLPYGLVSCTLAAYRRRQKAAPLRPRSRRMHVVYLTCPIGKRYLPLLNSPGHSPAPPPLPAPPPHHRLEAVLAQRTNDLGRALLALKGL